MMMGFFLAAAAAFSGGSAHALAAPLASGEGWYQVSNPSDPGTVMVFCNGPSIAHGFTGAWASLPDGTRLSVGGLRYPVWVGGRARPASSGPRTGLLLPAVGGYEMYLVTPNGSEVSFQIDVLSRESACFFEWKDLVALRPTAN